MKIHLKKNGEDAIPAAKPQFDVNTKLAVPLHVVQGDLFCDIAVKLFCLRKLARPDTQIAVSYFALKRRHHV